MSHFEKGKIEEFCSVQKGEIEGVETEVSCDGEFFIRSFLEKWSHYHNSNNGRFTVMALIFGVLLRSRFRLLNSPQKQ